MKKDTALTVAGIVFGVIAFMHLLRIIYVAEITISNYSIPMWMSWLALIVAFALSLYMFAARRKQF
jgi:lipopolysaccharide export LptBFGC system permease protein LptF